MNETSLTTTMTFEQAFQHGVSLYQQQKKTQAREVFEQILQHAPKNIAVLQILCVLDIEDNEFDTAMGRLDTALNVEPDNLSVWFDKANLLCQLGHNNEALSIVNALLEQVPDSQDLLRLKQQLAQAMGHRAETQKTVRELRNKETEKRQNIATEIEKTLSVAKQIEAQGNFQQAADLYSAVISIDDRHLDAYKALAQLQIELSQPESARQTTLRALDFADNDIRLLTLLAKAEILMGQHQSGRKNCRKILKIKSDELTAQRLLINSYEHQQNWIEVNRLASELSRSHPEDRLFLSQAAFSGFHLLRARHNFTADNIHVCKNNLERAISWADTQNQKDRLIPFLAETEWYAGNPKKSLALLDEYLARRPDNLDAAFNACFVHRTLGDWKNYYAAFEKGIDCGSRLSFQGELARWDLSRPKNDKVLVIPEQGIGDEIEFFHNLAMLAENCAKAYVVCEPRLEAVLKLAYPQVTAVPVKRVEHQAIDIPKDVIDDIDSWIAGGSLGAIAYSAYGKHHFLDSYLSPPDVQVELWKEKLETLKAESGKQHVVGICWRSGLAGASRNVHFLSVEDVAQLVRQCPDTLFVNLQYDDCSKEIKKVKKLCGVEIVQLEGVDLRDDFIGTAAVIQACDLIVSAGTAIFRLACAIGKECHLFYAWDKDSDPSQPVDLIWGHGFSYYYPPLTDNKYPVVDSIAKHIKRRLN
ncbi:tetratricopeptide repeat protein [Veronia pacifica]|uniref:Uncharacterized protein n=1 Tax=Veronia pacifica TaxID=1080227 RepID=A0A1C3E7J0_9GAMM|nr:tetratricopeptide repeat protein [Veronia pacifica]ODA29191.1 hypothetical protein A8L45_22645 [Veronia pacifica]